VTLRSYPAMSMVARVPRCTSVEYLGSTFNSATPESRAPAFCEFVWLVT